MDTKLSLAKQKFDNNDLIGALKIISKFPRLGIEKDIIKLGADCLNNPSFYKQLNYNIDECVNNAIDSMKRLYKW